MAEQDRGLTSRIGPVEVDWPRSIGFYGGIGLAVAAGMLEPPLAIFIAAVPVLKMLNRPNASRPVRFVGQVIEGAAKPVGGDTQATIELATSDEQGGRQPSSLPARRTIWAEARQLADRARTGG
jgi:hypothetical protein